LSSLLPGTLRLLVELALEQCTATPQPHWPAYVLKLIGRNDLCADGMLITRQMMNSAGRNGSDAMASRGGGRRGGRGGANAGAGSAGAGAGAGAGGAGGAGDSKKNGTDALEVSDGLMEVEIAGTKRFTADDRLHEVCRILTSSQPLYLKVEKPPELSELDYRHKLQLRLLSLSRRSMGCSVGRGMLTMDSLEPLVAEALPIPPILLSGRVPPNNQIVPLDTTNAHADLTTWPDFHNAVAAALRVGPLSSPNATASAAAAASGSGAAATASMFGAAAGTNKSNNRNTSVSGGGREITRNWMIYNRTASQMSGGSEASHAGFLMGLGLKGHLKALTISDVCEYLTLGHVPTTVAILIGYAASHIGSADSAISKTICLHVVSLLPVQHWDLDISPVVQVR
jgi:anaphase-promoting complex subunit 1